MDRSEIDFLVEKAKNYRDEITEEIEKLEAKKNFTVFEGDIFKIVFGSYMVVRLRDGIYDLINLYTGNRYSDYSYEQTLESITAFLFKMNAEKVKTGEYKWFE